MRPTRYTAVVANRHGVRADPVDFLASLPDFPAMVTAGARGGFERLLGNGGSWRIGPEPRADAGISAPIAPKVTFASVRVAIANSPNEIEAAHGLVRKRYAWRGYAAEITGNPDAPCRHPRLKQEITFVAANGETTIGTITLGLDGPFGLLAEETHAEVIRTARAAGRRVCELTRLAVEESVDSKSVLASLFSRVYEAGRTVHDVTDVFIEVNPRHVVFYSRILGFVVAAGERLCERVRAPSVLLHLELDALAKRLEILAESLAPQRFFAEAA